VHQFGIPIQPGQQTVIKKRIISTRDPRRIRRRSKLGHVFREKSASYGPGNTVIQSVKQYTNQYNVRFKMLYLINENAFVFRYFSTGESFRSLAFSFRMDHYTVRKTVDQVSDVLWSKLSSKHWTVPDHDRFWGIAVKFRERWNFS